MFLKQYLFFSPTQYNKNFSHKIAEIGDENVSSDFLAKLLKPVSSILFRYIVFNRIYSQPFVDSNHSHIGMFISFSISKFFKKNIKIRASIAPRCWPPRTWFVTILPESREEMYLQTDR